MEKPKPKKFPKKWIVVILAIWMAYAVFVLWRLSI